MLLTAFSGCALFEAPVYVPVTMRPAHDFSAAGIIHLGMEELEGNVGSQAQGILTGRLTDAGFTVSVVTAISPSPATPSPERTQGYQDGVSRAVATPQAIVTGSVQVFYTRDAGIESRYKDKEDKEHIVNFKDGIANLSGMLQVVEAGTGRVLVSSPLTAQVKERNKATDADPQAPNEASLRQRALRQGLEAFLREILPYDVNLEVRFASVENSPQTQAARDLARQGQWSDAHTLLTTVYEAAIPAEKGAAAYNLGLARLFTGDLDGARELFREATRLDPKQASLAGEGLRMADRLETSALGIGGR